VLKCSSMLRNTLLLFFLCPALLCMQGWSQIRTVSFGSGTSDIDGWANLNTANFSGYGGFPGSSAWPGPIGSNVLGSGDADLGRVSGGSSGGGPFLSSTSIYFGSFAQVANAFGGTLRISDATPLPNLKTLVFQIQIGEATGYDFYSPSGSPSLKLNGGSTAINPLFTSVVNRYQSGTYASPVTGLDEPVFVNTRGYQWDLSSQGAISSFSIDFSGVTHSQIYALQLNQSSSFFATAVIPEPGVVSFLTAGACFFLIRRRACVGA